MKDGPNPRDPILRGSLYTWELCETEDGTFQLCIVLDALTPEEARKEADEIVAIWNSNCAGIA